MKTLLENWKKYLLNEIEIVDNEEEEEYEKKDKTIKKRRKNKKGTRRKVSVRKRLGFFF